MLLTVLPTYRLFAAFRVAITFPQQTRRAADVDACLPTKAGPRQHPKPVASINGAWAAGTLVSLLAEGGKMEMIYQKEYPLYRITGYLLYFVCHNILNYAFLKCIK
jgi:hypothetical protein